MLTNLMALIMAPAPRFRWGWVDSDAGERNTWNACATRRAAGTLASVATAAPHPRAPDADPAGRLRGRDADAGPGRPRPSPLRLPPLPRPLAPDGRRRARNRRQP